eukprot:Skav224545  [mRNA]  locus=scaffold2085:22409:22840:+ [translate_table: standard]
MFNLCRELDLAKAAATASLISSGALDFVGTEAASLAHGSVPISRVATGARQDLFDSTGFSPDASVSDSVSLLAPELFLSASTNSSLSCRTIAPAEGNVLKLSLATDSALASDTAFWRLDHGCGWKEPPDIGEPEVNPSESVQL